MAKSKEQKESFITNWTEGQKYVIDDMEHQSKALVPIQIDTGNSVEIVQKIVPKLTSVEKKCCYRFVIHRGWEFAVIVEVMFTLTSLFRIKSSE